MKTIFTLILCLGFTQIIVSQNPLLIKQVNGTNLTPGESGSSRFYKHQVWNNKLFYSCSLPNGLCVTDGTTAGTQNIYTFTIPPGAIVSGISYLGPAQDFIYLRWRVQYATVGGVTPLDEQIWKTDGTTAGTQLVYSTSTTTAVSPLVFSNIASDPSRPASIIGNTLFFRNITAASGAELWKTDGTTAGTVIVKDIRPGTNGSAPVNFGNIGNKVLFYAGDGVVGRELWSTDGTEAGTVLVKDINPDNSSGGTSANSGSDFLQGETGVCNGKYFFYANIFNTVGAEPWVSDGTEAGTFLLKDINPGTASSNVTVNQADFLATDQYIFFRAKNLITQSGTGAALWRSDGTPDGTILLSIADTLSTTAATSVTGGNKFLMLINNGQSTTSARQYFLISDGTAGGTKVVDTGYFVLANPVIYKNAGYSTGARGVSVGTTSYDLEIFKTDGTKPGSGLAIDVFPGIVTAGSFVLYNSSSPQKYFVLNNYLYFFGRNAVSPFWGLFRYNGDFTFNNNLATNRWRDSANWNSMVPPGITDTAYVNGMNINVDGRNAYAGRLVMQPGSNINVVAATDSIFVHQSIEGTSFGGNGVLTLRNFNDDTVRVTNAVTANNVNVVGRAAISGNLTITNNLNLSNGARLIANNSNIILNGSNSNITNTPNSYIVTNDGGSLVIQDIGAIGRTGTVSFPVGTNENYNPVSIINSGDADAFSVRVRPGISSNYSGETPAGSSYTNGAVNATWFISEAVSGGSLATVGLQWNGSQELSSFDRTQSRVGHFVGGSWDLGAAGAASGSNPYSWSSSGFTSFSPFGILNNNLTLPVTRLMLSVQKTDHTNKCSWTVIANDIISLTLENSGDGAIFQNIYHTAVIGNNNYTDNVMRTGNTFYRLKGVTTTGRIIYSNIVWARGDSKELVQVYPTLFQTVLSVQNNTNSRATLSLITAEGKTTLISQLQPGTNLVQTEKLLSGFYFYNVMSDGKIIASGKLVKQ